MTSKTMASTTTNSRTTNSTTTEKKLLSQLRQTRIAARSLRQATPQQKNQVLLHAAKLLGVQEKRILRANQVDLKRLKKISHHEITPAFIDRLTLTPKRLNEMGQSLRQVAGLPDPIGEVVEARKLENGLKIQRVRAPLGVIFMIFESRPNVATEAFSLGFKAGNAMILRGGREASATVKVLYSILREALETQKLNSHSDSKANSLGSCLWGIEDSSRAIPEFLLQQKDWIDVVVPRGGTGLIDFVTRQSRIPVIKNDRGLCHIYVHQDADLEMAIRVIVNAKAQRPGVCNAMETLLVHQKVSSRLLPRLYEQLNPYSVEWHLCPKTYSILKGRPNLYKAKPADWDTEYLDFKMNCREVSSLQEAIAHIETHGSRHSESIITDSKKAAHQFQSEVDAAAVYWNASTRFTDGFTLGLGGELGISTQKLHARGPVGLRELTSVRWVMEGQGQVRE